MRKYIIPIILFLAGTTVNAQNVALKVGNTLSNITLKNTNGVVYDLKAQKAAKGFIVVFMTPTCDHCILYEKRVMALDKKYKTKAYPVVAIGPYGDDAKSYPLDAMPAMKKLAVKNGFTFPYLADEKFKYTWLLGIERTPTAVVLQKQANGFLIKYIGPIDDEPDTRKLPKHKYVETEVNKLIK